ncbi:hypothetical protein AB0L70_37585 [Kribbella sp. NPDC051952]|uniref:hypothetical protein n=1 Tax=Kribbella sp. NPDC051952 TaxID=3154851 RepID=UPI003418CCEE
MTITPTTLTRVAGIAAIAAGLLFVGVQIKHPHLDATSIGSTEVVVRNVLKIFMALFALVGITGMYLSQVRRNGLTGLIGYVVLGAGYLLILSNEVVAAFVMPTVAKTSPAYVNDVIAAILSHPLTGDIGLLRTVLHIQDFAFLAGGLVFGIALYRARVLARWAAVLLAVGGVVTIVLSLMPDAFYRLLAFPNGIAMIGLGYSLWRVTRTTQSSVARVPAGVE